MRQFALIAATLIAILAAMSPVSASAQTPPTVEVNLPAQPLDASLRALADKHKLQVLFSPGDVRGLAAPEIRGRYTVDAVMQRLTAGTNLAYSFNGQDTVVVRAKAADGKSGAPGGASSAGPIVAGSGSTPTSGVPQERITVTAQKREELLIDVPQSVTVLTANDLAKLGATQFRDFANTIPGLSFQTAGPGYTQISLRGLSVGQDIAGTVAIYLDEVPYGASTTFARSGQITLDSALFDVDRIEILRGPQGTLYGASSMGGLLKYVSKLPSTTAFRGEARVGISDTSDGGTNYDLAGAINVPIAENKVAVRLSAFGMRDAGYIDNLALGKEDVNSSEISGGRFDFLYMPIPKLSVRITGFLQNASADGLPTADFTLAGQPINGELGQRRLVDESFDQRYRLLSGTVNYDFDWASFISISSYQTIRSRLVVDGTVLYRPTLPAGINATAVGFSDLSTTDKFTQEVRLASRTGARPLEWLVGAFYTDEESGLDAEYMLWGPNGQAIPNTVYTFSGPSTYKEYAVFGDVTWHVNDKLDVTGGLRYAESRQTFEQIGTGAYGLSAPKTGSTQDVTTYLANARYRFSDHAAGYLRYATGYRPGGPNILVVDPVTGQREGTDIFEPDKLKSYEIGFKGETNDRRYGIELAGYYVDWSNIQINVTRRGFGTKANAPGGATIRGAEIALTAQPVTNLSVRALAAYQDARLDEALPAVAAQKDERLPTVPRVTASLVGDYAFAGVPLRPSVGGTLRYVGDSKTIFGPNGYPLPEYTMLDLRAGLALGNIDFLFYVRNVTDERAQVTPRFRYFLAAAPQVSILQPRTIGATLSMRF